MGGKTEKKVELLPLTGFQYTLSISRVQLFKTNMSLVNKILNFQMYVKSSAIFCWKKLRGFCSAKAPQFFSAKNNTWFDFVTLVRFYKPLAIHLGFCEVNNALNDQAQNCTIAGCLVNNDWIATSRYSQM